MTKAGRELALTWPDALPAPVLSGATATYRDVLPGVDLRMEAQETGYTQLLVVNSAEAAANPKLSELRLKLRAGGGKVSVPGSVLQNTRVQMNDARHRAAGGAIC